MSDIWNGATTAGGIAYFTAIYSLIITRKFFLGSSSDIERYSQSVCRYVTLTSQILIMSGTDVVSKQSEKARIHKLALEHAFEIFDRESRGIINVDEVGTVIRYLGHFPTERDLSEAILPEMTGGKLGAVVTLEKFSKVMLEMMLKGQFLPDTDSVIMRAFQTLDQNGRGYIEPERMQVLLTMSGDEPFRQQEVDQFFAMAKDPKTGLIYYEDYISQLSEEGSSQSVALSL